MLLPATRNIPLCADFLSVFINAAQVWGRQRDRRRQAERETEREPDRQRGTYRE